MYLCRRNRVNSIAKKFKHKNYVTNIEEIAFIALQNITLSCLENDNHLAVALKR